MFINLSSNKFLKILSLPIFLYLTFFEITIPSKEIKANNKLQPATEQDLYLYKGMGASYLCIASEAGIEFPQALGVATATYVQVVEGKHGGAVKELGDDKLEREKLFAGAEFLHRCLHRRRQGGERKIRPLRHRRFGRRSR